MQTLRYHRDVSGYFVENFGCRATQADGAALERQFEERGLSRASTPAQASVVVMNTCTVTASADQDARAAIRRVRRQNPEAQIVVTGCYAQRAPEEIAALPGVSLVIGNSHKHRLAEIVGAAAAQSTLKSECLSTSNAWVKTESQGELCFESSKLQPRNGGIGEPCTEVPGEVENTSQSRRDGTGSHAHFLAQHGDAFVPLTTLSAPPGSREPEAESPIFVSDIFAHTELLAAPVFDAANERTRPNLKVQDGCDNRCSFCVIPFVRGQSRSLPIDRILSEVNGLVASGYREVVISGINLGRWGRDLSGSRLPASGFRESLPCSEELRTQPSALSPIDVPDVRGLTSDASRKPRAGSRKPDLPSLIRAILTDTALEKLRVSSVEPMDWTDDLISLVASSPRIAKHAHVPMQSASDPVLRRMHRKYRPWHYREKIEKIRAAMPTAAIGADVMVGFPGETNAEFEATRRVIEDLPFTYLHVFTYSARPGTPAATMPNQVPVQAARERNRILRELAAEKKLDFMRSFIGQKIEAITLRSHEERSQQQNPCCAGALSREACSSESPESEIMVPYFTEALTDNYLKLHLRGRHEPNRWLYVRIEDVVDGALQGLSPNR
jgi:threonylcarbamoyladenosine tRNA methylthiotransferase MtaB